jgi:hypothetical protein
MPPLSGYDSVDSADLHVTPSEGAPWWLSTFFSSFASNAQNPPLGDSPTTDSYFSSTFPEAVVFEISDFDFDVQNTIDIGSAATGAGAGKASLGQLVIHRTVDKLSPALLNLSTVGQHLAAIQLYLRHPNPPLAAPLPLPSWPTSSRRCLSRRSSGRQLPVLTSPRR